MDNAAVGSSVCSGQGDNSNSAGRKGADDKKMYYTDCKSITFSMELQFIHHIIRWPAGSDNLRRFVVHPRRTLSLRMWDYKDTKSLESLSVVEKRPVSEIVSDTPTRHLYVCNCGAGFVGVSITRDDVEAIFRTDAPDGFEAVSFLKGKTYAIATYATLEQAARARELLHRTHSRFISKPLLLHFVRQLPSQLSENPTATDTRDMTHRSNPVLPPGLTLIEDFITVEQEQALLAHLASTNNQWQVLSKRKVQHYGYEFDYLTKNANRDPGHGNVVSLDFPDWLTRTISGMQDRIDFHPDQLTINHYDAGQGIPHHIDTHSAFFDPIVSLSLDSGIVVEFKHPEGSHVNVYLPPRSLMVMSREARLLWSHGITPRKTDIIDTEMVPRRRRISLTFRRVRPVNEPCTCPYYAQCDRWRESIVASESAFVPGKSPLEKAPVAPSIIEATYVHQTYNKIASEFSKTRYKPWPAVRQFLESLPVGSLVADVGCGNGRYLDVNPQVFKIGCDRSEGLIAICRQRGFETFVANGLTLPYRNSCFDAVMCIAVLHHLSTQEHRIQAVKELIRIARPGATILIYVWAMEQEERSFGQQDLFVPWHVGSPESSDFPRPNGSEIAVTGVEYQAVTPGDESIAMKRFYHVFRKGELVEMCLKAGEAGVGGSNEISYVGSGFERGNYFVRLQKMTQPV